MMYRFTRIAILTGILLLSSAETFAADATDCSLVELYYNEDGSIRDADSNGWNALFQSSNQYVQEILKNDENAAFPADNVIKAIDSLRGYCCAKQYLKADKGICKQGLDFTSPKRPESRFLYDHLITVGFQRLDGLYDESVVPMPEMKASEWREKINELATAPEGSIPLQVVKTFDAYWYDTVTEGQQSSPIRIVHIDKTQNWERGLEKIIGIKRTDMGLSSKYYSTCYISLFLNPRTDRNGSKKSDYELCKRLANNRISQEVGYVQTVSIEQGALLLSTNPKNYLNTYFAQEAMMRSIDKWGNLTSLFKYLATKTQGTHSCSF